MDSILHYIKAEVYDKCSLILTNFKIESESLEYNACQFDINKIHVISRSSKITPKKNGQFVTFWKRNEKGLIEPFEDKDPFDLFIVNVRKDNRFGQFVFPKDVLIKKGILSKASKEGKRAFRVYPIWDNPSSKQAIKTQKWQLNYFYDITKSIDFEKVSELYYQ